MLQAPAVRVGCAAWLPLRCLHFAAISAFGVDAFPRSSLCFLDLARGKGARRVISTRFPGGLAVGEGCRLLWSAPSLTISRRMHGGGEVGVGLDDQEILALCKEYVDERRVPSPSFSDIRNWFTLPTSLPSLPSLLPPLNRPPPTFLLPLLSTTYNGDEVGSDWVVQSKDMRMPLSTKPH